MNRRRFLLATSAVGTVGVAGCLGGDDDDDDDPDDGENGDPDNGQNGDPDSTGIDAEFAIEPAEPVQGRPVTLDASGSTGGIEAYRWDFTGDGETDETGAVVTHTFEEAGEHTVTLAVEGADGETDTTTAGVTVVGEDDEVQAAFGIDQTGPEEFSLDATASASRAGNIVEYRWVFVVDGDTVEESTAEPVASYTLDVEQSLAVTLEVEDSEGNVGTATEELVFAAPPAPTIDWEPDGPEPGQPVTFQAETLAGEVDEYRWDFTDDGVFETTTADTTATHTFEDARIYMVTLEATGPGGTEQTSEPIAVGVPGLEVSFNWEPENPAPGEEISFDASATPGDVLEYRWQFGREAVETEDPVTTHTFEQAGELPVQLEIQRDGATASAEVPILVGKPAITAAFEVDPADPDPGAEVTLDASDSTGDIEEYRWAVAGPEGTEEFTTTDPVTTYTFDAESVYTVFLETAGPEGTASAVQDVLVGDPIDEFTATFDWEPETPAAGEEVTFDSSDSVSEASPIVEYRWVFDYQGETELDFDATTEGPTVTHTFDESRDHTVLLVIENGDGEQTGADGIVSVE